MASSILKLFRASNVEARIRYLVGDKFVSVSAWNICRFLSVQGLLYQVCILKYRNSETVTLHAAASICHADQADQYVWAALVASWHSCCLLTACLFTTAVINDAEL